ncbi:MAG TPA: alcohol dehydrogenase catalytic domain-containing protein [Gemmatimonadales bacterium]|nr:alcohol dehydrogenase catalytic domain-containing protein [Gemmatimonadales bacterium]
MKSTMEVARIHGAGDVRLHDEPVPTPRSGEALVKVTAVGVCGSDVHWFREGHIGGDRIETPLVLGHECAGVIQSGARRGERVAIDPAQACGRCRYCEEGNPNLCEVLRFAGHAPQDGAMCGYVAWPEHCLVPLPEALTDVDGALLEPLGVAMYAVELGAVGPGMSVGVFGAGPIGLLTLQVAKVAGATRLFATDRADVPHRLGAARAIGAAAFAVHDCGEADDILTATGGRGVDVAFEAAGDPEAVEAAVVAVKPGGRVILIGIPSADRIAFTASVARRKDLLIRVVHRMKHTYPRAIRLVEGGRVDLRSLATHRFPLADVAGAFAVAERREGLKIIIEC